MDLKHSHRYSQYVSDNTYTPAEEKKTNKSVLGKSDDGSHGPVISLTMKNARLIVWD